MGGIADAKMKGLSFGVVAADNRDITPADVIGVVANEEVSVVANEEVSVVVDGAILPRIGTWDSASDVGGTPRPVNKIAQNKLVIQWRAQTRSNT